MLPDVAPPATLASGRFARGRAVAQEWYAQIDGVTVGPLEMRALRELAVEGRLTGETPVRLGDEEWTRASKVSGLLDLSDAAMAAVDAGSRQGITIDPSLNDTTEWRMLADTAKTADVKDPNRERPLPRRAGPTDSGAAESPPASRTILTLVVVGIVLVGAVALLVWSLSG
jgi:hypothetical protein